MTPHHQQLNCGTMSSNLSFQFIRNVNSNKEDDTAFIQNIDVDKYRITYTDIDIKKKMSFETNGHGVFRWVRRVLSLLEKDVDPYHYIQLNVHAMPATMFRVANLQENYHTILDAIECYLDNMSMSVAAPSTPKKQCVSTPQACPGAPARRHTLINADGQEFSYYYDYSKSLDTQKQCLGSRSHLFFDEDGNECRPQ